MYRIQTSSENAKITITFWYCSFDWKINISLKMYLEFKLYRLQVLTKVLLKSYASPVKNTYFILKFNIKTLKIIFNLNISLNILQNISLLFIKVSFILLIIFNKHYFLSQNIYIYILIFNILIIYFNKIN